MKIANLIVRWTIALAFATAIFAVSAQTYPVKPVRVIVPYAAGGMPDVLARTLSIPLSSALGQQFVVDNRPGAGGIGAADLVAKSPADGYTVFFSDIQQLAINPFLFTKLPYHPARDFTPVMLLGTVPLYIVAQESLNIKSLAELVAAAKLKPEILTYGSSGVGSIHQIAMEAMTAALGIKLIHVPYKGSAASIPAFMGKQTALIVAAASPQLDQYVKSGSARMLAVTTATRSPLYPDVPAVAETISGFDFSSEMGVVVPAGTPSGVVTQLSQELGTALKDPGVVQRLTSLGITVISSTPDGYSQNIKANLVKFQKAIQAAAIQPN